MFDKREKLIVCFSILDFMDDDQSQFFLPHNSTIQRLKNGKLNKALFVKTSKIKNNFIFA